MIKKINFLLKTSLTLVFVLALTFLYQLQINNKLNAFSTTSAVFGGANNQRITIPLTNNSLNVGAGDFTIEFWVKIDSVTAGQPCSNGNDVFTEGGLIFDRDMWGNGNNGDFGISVMNDNRLAFSINNGSVGVTACSTALSLDTWYYIAAVKSGNSISIYVNGVLSQTQSWVGSNDLSYDFSHTSNPACPGPCQDQTIVLGAEKHYVGYNLNGLMDELHVSNVARSIAPRSTTFTPDANTVALYRFENNPNSEDSANNGTASNITYSTDIPFTSSSPTTTVTTTVTSTVTGSVSPSVDPSISPTAVTPSNQNPSPTDDNPNPSGTTPTTPNPSSTPIQTPISPTNGYTRILTKHGTYLIIDPNGNIVQEQNNSGEVINTTFGTTNAPTNSNVTNTPTSTQSNSGKANLKKGSDLTWFYVSLGGLIVCIAGGFYYLVIWRRRFN